MSEETKVPLMDAMAVSVMSLICIVLVAMLAFGVYSYFVLIENNPSTGFEYQTREFWISLKEWLQ